MAKQWRSNSKAIGGTGMGGGGATVSHRDTEGAGEHRGVIFGSRGAYRICF